MMPFLDGAAPLPPCPDCAPPGPVEALVGFMLGYLLLVILVIWLLPTRWTRWIFLRDEE